MNGRKKTLYVSTFSKIFSCFLNKGCLIFILHWTPQIVYGPSHLVADWFEHKIIDLGLGSMKIKSLKEFNHIFAVLS